MSWTQVHISGLDRTVEPDDEEIERRLDALYALNSDGMWAGPGTTLVKRDQDTKACRGFAFLAFYSADAAVGFIERLNTHNNNNNNSTKGIVLTAALAEGKPKKSKKGSSSTPADNDQRDLGFRSKRKAPIRKHPVIKSSDGKRTGLGNKTK